MSSHVRASPIARDELDAAGRRPGGVVHSISAERSRTRIFRTVKNRKRENKNKHAQRKRRQFAFPGGRSTSSVLACLVSISASSRHC